MIILLYTTFTLTLTWMEACRFSGNYKFTNLCPMKQPILASLKLGSKDFWSSARCEPVPCKEQEWAFLVPIQPIWKQRCLSFLRRGTKSACFRGRDRISSWSCCHLASWSWQSSNWNMGWLGNGNQQLNSKDYNWLGRHWEGTVLTQFSDYFCYKI